MREKIKLSDIILWFSVIVFILILTWWVFGSSPTIETISLGATLIGASITWAGFKRSNRTYGVLHSMQDSMTEQTKTLKSIERALKRGKK